MAQNKGERSEAYVILKLVADGELAEGDAYLRPVSGNSYRLLKIFLKKVIRGTEPIKRFIEIENDGRIFVCEGDSVLKKFENNEDFKAIAEILFKEICAKTNSSSSTALEEFLKQSKLDGYVNKTAASQKSDLKIEILDRGTNSPKVLGFSIKSHLGAAPTLVNASQSTNLEYELVGAHLSDSEIEAFNGMKKANGKTDWDARLDFLKKRNISIKFLRCANPIFEANLMTVDTSFPRVFSEIVKNHFLHKTHSFVDALKRLAETDPLSLRRRLDAKSAEIIYEVMLKRFLRQSVLGMNAATPWNGKTSVSGGIIVVVKTGELVGFFAYNFDELDSLLFRSAKFDTPSARKHSFGSIKKNRDGMLTLMLNFQIRDESKSLDTTSA